jgi:hypothetical protein
VYEITGLPPSDFPDDVERFYDDPRHLKSDLSRLRYLFPGVTFAVLRDGILANEASFDEDVRRFEIHLTMQEADKVPSGYRRGWGTDLSQRTFRVISFPSLLNLPRRQYGDVWPRLPLAVTRTRAPFDSQHKLQLII